MCGQVCNYVVFDYCQIVITESWGACRLSYGGQVYALNPVEIGTCPLCSWFIWVVGNALICAPCISPLPGATPLTFPAVFEPLMFVVWASGLSVITLSIAAFLRSLRWFGACCPGDERLAIALCHPMCPFHTKPEVMLHSGDLLFPILAKCI